MKKKTPKRVQQYAVSKKKPAKRVLKCSTKEWKNLSRASVLRKKTEEIYKEKYSGKSVVNLSTGIKIQFDKHGASKTSRGGSIYAEKAALVTILDKICRQGYLYSLGKAKETDIPKGVICFLNFKANVIVDDKYQTVLFSVRVMKSGTFHYHIDIPIKFVK